MNTDNFIDKRNYNSQKGDIRPSDYSAKHSDNKPLKLERNYIFSKETPKIFPYENINLYRIFAPSCYLIFLQKRIIPLNEIILF